MALPAQTFDPARYLTKVKGNDYLEVKWRLVWLRDQHPDAVIETDLVSHSGNHAIFRAQVTLPTGGGATGWGSEDINGFANYIEKAETKAIGRALAALGFGTQFCDDMVYGAAEGHVVDAPVARGPQPTAMFGSGRPQANRDQAHGAGPGRDDVRTTDPSPKQVSFIRSVARELRMDEQALDQFCHELTGSILDQLNRRDASTVIEQLKVRQQERSR
ncbi:MAG: hypothetical protein WBA46_14380 [Thermomicrobiales bacterium]